MNGRLSFAQVDELSDAFAGYLRAVVGLKPGDRVAVQLPNSLGYPVAALGVFKAGCVLVNTNPLYTETEMVHQFNNAGAKVLVMVDMFADKLPAVLAKTGIKQVVLASVSEFFPAIPGAIVRGVQRYWNRVLPPVTAPHVRLKDALAQGRATLAQTPARTYWEGVGRDDLALLQYTGGTTGVSKGAMLTHGNLLNNIQQTRAMGQTHMAPGQECVLTALPLYHIFAFTTNLLGFLAIGGHNVLIPNPAPGAEPAARHGELPHHLDDRREHPVQRPAERGVVRGLPAQNAQGVHLGRHGAAHGGGTTLARTHENPDRRRLRPDRNLPGGQLQPAHRHAARRQHRHSGPGHRCAPGQRRGAGRGPGTPGEIWVRGPQVMRGYWNAAEETAKVMQDGWFATGDVAVMDEGGFMRIVDRKKDMILVSGFNVYPNEVEDVIADMDHVLEVAVIGVPDAKTGEAVRAYVVQNPDHKRK
jgi:long-chain acyl-CoA synthetase